MKIFNIVIASLVLITLGCHKGKNNPEACNGDTRRELKVLIDNAITSINYNPVITTVTDLGNLEVPEVDSDTKRQSVEMQVYTVTAKVDKCDKKWDGDYHIRLIEGDNYLITEVPNTGCSYAQQSSYLGFYAEVREFLSKNDIEGKTVTVTGVAFVDIDHKYKRKQAKNNIELHPIFSIKFN